MLRLADLPADRLDTGTKKVAFDAGPKFLELAQRYGMTPTKLAWFAARTLEAIDAPRITVSREEGIALETLR